MYISILLTLSTFVLAFVSGKPIEASRITASGDGGRCSFKAKRTAVKAELDTIVSHSLDDANRIPLAPGATRTFHVTPNEFPLVTLTVNVGMNAQTVRNELVLLATALTAGVPAKSIHYINNGNGTVTSDFVQTDGTMLPYVHVREVHYFNSACEITDIVGYVHGDLVCPADPRGLLNSVLRSLCLQLEALGLIGKIQPLVGP